MSNITETVPFENNTYTYNSSQIETREDINVRYFEKLVPVTSVFVCLAFAGVVGNFLVLLVFPTCRDHHGSTMKVFVVCFAILDFTYCLTMIPAEIFKYRNYFGNSNIMCKVSCFWHTFATSSAALLFLVVAIDRYRKVCHQFKVQISSSTAKRLCCLIVFCGVVFSIPAPIMCGIKDIQKENSFGTNTTVKICASEARYENSSWRKIYKMFLLILLLILSVVYIVLYVFMGKKIVRHVSIRSGGGGSISLQANGKLGKRKKTSPPTSQGVDDVFPEGAIDRDTSDIEDSFSFGVPAMPKRGSKPRLNSQNSGSNDRNKSRGRIFSRSTSIFSTFSQRRQSATHIPNKTLIWLILTVLFIVTYITHAGTANVSDVYTMEPGMFALYMFFNRLYFSNHVLNPIVYACLDKRFRKQCSKLFAKKCCRV